MKEQLTTEKVNQMYEEYARKYAYAPIRMTRAEAFGYALEDGLITKADYEAIRKLYADLWNYSGE